ncbi:MAG: hypothetical protein U0452_12045 [Anaerolineae bacterium]
MSNSTTRLDPTGTSLTSVIDLDEALAFYGDGIGLQTVRRDGNTVSLAPAADATLIVAWTGDPKLSCKPRASTGLYHIAIRTPDRLTLANLLRRLRCAACPSAVSPIMR